MDWLSQNQMTTSRKDYFSKQSAEYAKHRPTYPEELFSYLASLTSNRECALDCATGNGQAALGLARHFDEVIAIDQSEAQIAGATPHPRIRYMVGKVEQLQLPGDSVDLVTIAQALHWFDLASFYPEMKRVLKPDGVIAAWTYGMNHITPEIDVIVRRYHDEVVGSYWPEERKFIGDGYHSLPFPFHEISPPSMSIDIRWTVNDLLGFLRSWSATQRYIDKNGRNPVKLIKADLEHVWGDAAERKSIVWPLSFRIGMMTS
jgi:SAM-dependent methyltransferase